MDEELYDGVPVVALPILEVDVPDPTHLQRSLRYPNAIDIEPVAAIEAALDPCGLLARDPKSRTGEAIRIIGYSPTAERVLLVVLLPHEHPRRDAGTWSRHGRHPGAGARLTRPTTRRHDDHSRSRTARQDRG